MSLDLVMVFICIAVALVGVLAAAIAWRRHHTGRMVQAGAIVLLPIALFCTGLLPLVVQAVTAIGGWAVNLSVSPLVGVGFGLLALTVVLWVVGGILVKRNRGRAVGSGSPAASAGQTSAGRGQPVPAVGTGRGARAGAGQPNRSGKPGQSGKTAAPVDDDMAEIEALLKSRGIE